MRVNRAEHGSHAKARNEKKNLMQFSLFLNFTIVSFIWDCIIRYGFWSVALVHLLMRPGNPTHQLTLALQVRGLMFNFTGIRWHDIFVFNNGRHVILLAWILAVSDNTKTDPNQSSFTSSRDVGEEGQDMVNHAYRRNVKGHGVGGVQLDEKILKIWHARLLIRVS